MKVLILAMASMFASVLGAYEEPVYTVTVAEGTNSLDGATVEVTQNGETTSAAFSSLTLDKGGTFVKKGLGWLQSSSAMSVFTGEVVVAEGALILTEDGQAGRILNNVNYRVSPAWTNCASLVVSNGATVALITSANETFPHLVQPVSLSGEGLDGLGAIYHYCISKEDKGTQLYYSHITLNGDTKIVFENDGRLGIGYCVVDMNGYDLTSETPGENRGMLVLCGLKVQNPGNIVGDHTQLYFSDSKTWEGTAANTVTLTNNAYFRMYNFGGQIKWTLVNDSENLGGYANAASTTSTSNQPNRNIWHGPWRLNESVTLGAANESTDNHGIVLNGAVSGDGGISLRHQWLRLRSRSNTFKGGVTVTTSGHLVLYGNGSIPANGGMLKIHNGGEVILDEEKAAELGLKTMAYPAIDWNVSKNSEAVLPGTTNTIIKSLVKRGSGTLNLVGDIPGTEDHVGVATVTGVTEIAAGTLRIPCGSAGLVSGWFTSEESGNEDNSAALGNIDYMATNKIVLRAEVAYTSDTNIWRKGVSPSKGVFAYRGYIWNRTQEDMPVVFAQAMWKGSRLFIDGVRLEGYDKPWSTKNKVSYYHGSGDNQRLTFCSTTLSPGPHQIDFRTYTSSDWGPWGNPNNDKTQNDLTNAVWKANFGWAVNWSGSDSTNHVDFSEIRDPGDGSLFTVTTNGADMTIASLRTSFEHLKFTGGTLDVYGSDLYVPVLECGSGSITNSNEYLTNNIITVTGSVRVDSASYRGGTLKIDGKLRFAEGATLDGADLALLARGDYSLVEAADGIEGMPSFDSNADGNKGWRVKKEVVDGVEKLTFGWHLGTVVTFR